MNPQFWITPGVQYGDVFKRGGLCVWVIFIGVCIYLWVLIWVIKALNHLCNMSCFKKKKNPTSSINPGDLFALESMQLLKIIIHISPKSSCSWNPLRARADPTDKDDRRPNKDAGLISLRVGVCRVHARQDNGRNLWGRQSGLKSERPDNQ